MTLNPAFLRAASKQEQQATDESPVGSLNVANLNTKAGDSNESQTIAVNYNLLRNDDIVRWNGTDVKLRSPTGLTTINRVKFRSFVGDLLPYTSLSLPSLKCNIVAYVSPQYDPRLESSNETTGYVIGSESGNFDPYEIDVNNRKTTVIQSYTKPWTYNSDSEDSQIEYNIEEMLRYVNASFSSFLSDLTLSFMFLQQSNLEIVSDFDVYQYLDGYAKPGIPLDSLVWCKYVTTSSLVFFGNTSSSFNIAPVSSLDGQTLNYPQLLSTPINPHESTPIAIAELNTSYTEGFAVASENNLQWCAISYELNDTYKYTRCHPSGSTTTSVSYVWIKTNTIKPLWNVLGIASCPNGIGYTNCYGDVQPYNAKFNFNFNPRGTSTNKYVYDSSLYVKNLFASEAVVKYAADKVVDCQCCGYTIVESGSGFNISAAFAVLGYDSNHQLRVVYDFATILYNNGTAARSSPNYGTKTFDDGILFEDYKRLHLDRRDSQNFDYPNRIYYVPTLESNVSIACWFDRYFFKVNKSTGLVVYQPVPIITERVYIGTDYYYFGPSRRLTDTSDKHYRVAYSSAHMSASSYYENIVNTGYFAKSSDLSMPAISYEDYDRVMTIPSKVNGSDAVTVSLLLCRNFYEANGTYVKDRIMKTDITFVKSMYTSKALTTQLSTNGTKQMPINTVTTVSGETLPSISLYDSTYFSYIDGVMRFPYISYTNGYVVSLVPVFYTEPYYFKTSISLPSAVSASYTLDTYEYTPEIKTLNDSALQLLETLLLLQYEYNDLQLRCSNFPNNDNVVFSVNEICRIAFKVMQTNANSFELVINICDSSGGAIELETLKRLYGKLQLSVDFEK